MSSVKLLKKIRYLNELNNKVLNDMYNVNHLKNLKKYVNNDCSCMKNNISIFDCNECMFFNSYMTTNPKHSMCCVIIKSLTKEDREKSKKAIRNLYNILRELGYYK